MLTYNIQVSRSYSNCWCLQCCAANAGYMSAIQKVQRMFICQDCLCLNCCFKTCLYLQCCAATCLCLSHCASRCPCLWCYSLLVCAVLCYKWTRHSSTAPRVLNPHPALGSSSQISLRCGKAKCYAVYSPFAKSAQRLLVCALLRQKCKRRSHIARECQPHHLALDCTVARSTVMQLTIFSDVLHQTWWHMQCCATSARGEVTSLGSAQTRIWQWTAPLRCACTVAKSTMMQLTIFSKGVHQTWLRVQYCATSTRGAVILPESAQISWQRIASPDLSGLLRS